MVSWVATPHLLLGGTLVVAAGAVVSDVATRERPTHLVVLGVVAVAIAALSRQLASAGITPARAVAAAVTFQPVLHLGAYVLHPNFGPHHHPHRLLHALVHEAATATLQILVPVFVALALALVARLAWLLANGLGSQLAPLPALPVPAGPVLLRVGLVSMGSMLHWCGWTIVAGRRGPPFP